MFPQVEKLVESLLDEETKKAILVVIVILPKETEDRQKAFRLMNRYCQTEISFRGREDRMKEEIELIKMELLNLVIMLDPETEVWMESSYMNYVKRLIKKADEPIEENGFQQKQQNWLQRIIGWRQRKLLKKRKRRATLHYRNRGQMYEISVNFFKNRQGKK